MTTKHETSPQFSIPSVLAVVAAIASFYSGAILGLVFAAIALVTGLIGLVLALSPQKRGGITSFLAIIGGGLGVIAAIVKAVLFFV